MSFLLKLAFIIFIIIFVRERITKNWLAITAIVIVCIVFSIFYWPVFGSIYVIYILITIGIGSVLVDTFFVTMQEGHGGTSPEYSWETRLSNRRTTRCRYGKIVCC